MHQVHRDLHVIFYILRKIQVRAVKGPIHIAISKNYLNFLSVFVPVQALDGILNPSKRKTKYHHLSAAPCPRIPLNQSRDVGEGREGSQTLRFQVIKQAEFN